MGVAKIPSSRIVLAGHSLGTAVVGGIVAHYAKTETDFAGVVLVSGFSHLPTMLAQYRFGGIIPVFGPIRFSPRLMTRLHRFIVDDWHTKARIQTMVEAATGRTRLVILHGAHDRDIPFNESHKLFEAAIRGAQGEVSQTEIAFDDGSLIREWACGNTTIRYEIVAYAGEYCIKPVSNLSTLIYPQ